MAQPLRTDDLQSDLSFETFLASLQDPDRPGPTVSPKRFGQALRIDLQTLAEQAGVHRNTLSRAPDSPSVQRYLREAVRVIRAATDLGGDVNKALFWYRNEPLQPFGYKTPECLVAEGRSEDLLRYVTSLEAGPTG